MRSKIVYFTIFLAAITCTYWTALPMSKDKKTDRKIDKKMSKKKLAELVTCKEYLVGTDKIEDYQKVKSPLSPKSSGKKREQKLNLKKKKNQSFSYDDNKLEELKKEFEKNFTIKNKAYSEKEDLYKKSLDKEAFEEIYPEREDSFCEEKSESIEVNNAKVNNSLSSNLQINNLDNAEREDSISFSSEDDYGNESE